MRHHASDCLALFNSEQARLRAINEPTPEPETPAWLPEGAVAHFDFAAGHYYWDSAERQSADLTDVFGASDGNTFSTAAISASGLRIHSDNTIRPKAAGALLALLRAGAATFVMEIEDIASVDDTSLFFDARDGEYAFQVLRYDDQFNYYTFSGYDIDAYSGAFAAGDINKFALTLNGTAGAISGNGAAVDGGTGPAPILAAADFYFGSDLVGGAEMNGFLRSLTIYPAQLDAALPALSALS